MEQISLNSVLKEPILRQLNSRAQLSAHFVILENIVMKEEWQLLEEIATLDFIAEVDHPDQTLLDRSMETNVQLDLTA